jgi:CubicO group peptidase (beta-lactamase class C family)
MRATAAATRNLGCTLVRPDASHDTLRARGAPDVAGSRPDPATVDWPLGDRLPDAPPEGIDVPALQRAVAAAFAPAAAHTRAVVVLHRGRLVAESYADGYRADMALPGWSMTKTLTYALLGARAQQGELDCKRALAVPEWRGDARRAIGFDDLLTMTGGLAWNEDYDDPNSDALRMLFRSSDCAAVYAACARTAAPGERFCYASGATNLLCRVLRGTFADDREYWSFPRQALFARLGMRTAVLETDPGGTFVGSSYGFASARDWARLGLLFANDGVAGGERILPAGWVAAAVAPHRASAGRYGRLTWLDRDPDGDGPQTREWPDLPADLFYMSGHEGQYCFVLPGDELVVVRLGCTKNGGSGLHALLRGVRAACRR